MATSARLELVAIDAPDIQALAFFYTQLTGWSTVLVEPDWITLRTPDEQEVAFQLAPDYVPPQWPGQQRPQQCHLDLLAEDHEAAAIKAVGLGATRLGAGATWITLADPAGHPFDLCQRDGVGPGISLYAVTFDAPDGSALGRFYAELLGLPVAYEGPEGALVSGTSTGLMFQNVENYSPPEWRNPHRPQQGHLDLKVENMDEGQTRALELGASRLDGGGQHFRVFADPAGHPFCLTI